MELLALMYILNVNEAMDWEIELTNQENIAWISKAPKAIDTQEVSGNWCQDDGTMTRCGFKNFSLCKFNNWLDSEKPCREK